MSLEMALVTPILLLLILGVASIGHALLVRYILGSTAYDAARTCVLARQTTLQCAQAVVRSKMGSTRAWCNRGGGPAVMASARPDASFPVVSTFDVRLVCDYGFMVGGGYLRSQGIVLTHIDARAAMPY